MARKITIENKVVTTAQQMKDVSRDLGIDINEAYCGFLRQPINTTAHKGYYQIDGVCALNNIICVRYITEDTQFKPQDCQIYKAFFERYNNG